IIFGLAAAFLMTSLAFIYLTHFPSTESPNNSILYFGTIAKMSNENFKIKFKTISEEDYLDDMLTQIHRISGILERKFYRLKTSLICLFLAVVPWLLAIYFSKLLIK